MISKKYYCFSCEHTTNNKEDNCGCHSQLEVEE
jgi:hypothetical protein